MQMGKDSSSLTVKVCFRIFFELPPHHCVKVVMGRRLLGVFMTVYMPTILMNLIGHSTNYFSEIYFEATISVNLTASSPLLKRSASSDCAKVMLVLTTMFVSVSNELPKTSYMKMVDYWLVFNLFIPFAEVLLHVYMVSGITCAGVLNDV